MATGSEKWSKTNIAKKTKAKGRQGKLKKV
jgi:hypothetical protein